jgi:hypothetical protein
MKERIEELSNLDVYGLGGILIDMHNKEGVST